MLWNGGEAMLIGEDEEEDVMHFDCSECRDTGTVRVPWSDSGFMYCPQCPRGEEVRKKMERARIREDTGVG